jgi:hypothetical protein
MASDNTLHADILDNGLGTFDTAADAGTLKVAIIKTGVISNSFNPNDSGSYATITSSSNNLGNHTLAAGEVAAPSFISGTYGREVVFSAISGASVTATGTATHFAVYDTGASKVYATGDLSASQGVTSGNTFSLATFNIGIPAPA